MPKNVFDFSRLFNPNTWYSCALVFTLWCPKINWRLSLKSFSKYLVVMVSLWKTYLIRGAAWYNGYLMTIRPLFKTRLGRIINDIFFSLSQLRSHIFWQFPLLCRFETWRLDPKMKSSWGTHGFMADQMKRKPHFKTYKHWKPHLSECCMATLFLWRMKWELSLLFTLLLRSGEL